AWIMWAVVHIAFIVNFRNRFRVLLGWFFNWLMSSRDARLIVGDARPRVRLPQAPGFEPTEPTPPKEEPLRDPSVTASQ
ncbi:MAG: NAD(P)/FAD-dependent oxidoreductase, partial [Myxococcota bacterium]